ncbi:MAG: hypothetical protein P9M08_06415 [Candidatus Erginobacter occultus]|nr:hypothetical protein [Candidatus Erginobacter occultus]
MKQLLCVLAVGIFSLAALSAPAADFDGDGYDDIAIFRPSTGLWAIRDVGRYFLGRNGDIPVPGRYITQAHDDIAIFRPSTGLWAINGGPRYNYGQAGDTPVVGGGGGSAWTRTGDNIYRSTGNVTIGTTNTSLGSLSVVATAA